MKQKFNGIGKRIIFMVLLFMFIITKNISVNAAMLKAPATESIAYEIEAPFMRLFGVTLEDPNKKLQKQKKSEEKIGTFNYVAIGNSLTKHELTGFWWNECGMAATTADKDYVHKVAYGIEDLKNTNVSFEAIALKDWENLPESRSEVAKILDPYLNEDTNLVTIELGDNARDYFEADYETLLLYIKEKAPNAQILTIGTFLSADEKDVWIKDASDNLGVPYVSLAGLKNNPEYQSQMDSVVYDAAGGEHRINLQDVAVHPNDYGMECIAERVLEVLQHETSE